MDPNVDRLPHRNPNNFDLYAIPIHTEYQLQSRDQGNPFSDYKMVQSQYRDPYQSIPKPMLPFPMDIQGPSDNQYQSNDVQNDQKMYWTQRQQNWITLSYNMNPLAFASPELFKSANMSLSESTNPIACVLVFIFKAMILLTYFGYPYVGITDKVILFRIVIVLASIDFWIVKNVCGRLLVGLRWWVEIDDLGAERWVFETRLQKMSSITQRIQSRIFWFIQLFMAMMFIGMFLVNLFTFEIDIVFCVCIQQAISMALPAIMTGFNLWAFNMCNKVKKSRMGEYMMVVSNGQNKRSIKMPLKID